MKNHWLLHARIYRSGIPHYVSNTTKSYLSRCSKRFGSSPDDLHSSIFPTFDNVLVVSSCKKESIETHLHEGSSLIFSILEESKVLPWSLLKPPYESPQALHYTGKQMHTRDALTTNKYKYKIDQIFWRMLQDTIQMRGLCRQFRRFKPQHRGGKLGRRNDQRGQFANQCGGFCRTVPWCNDAPVLSDLSCPRSEW